MQRRLPHLAVVVQTENAVRQVEILLGPTFPHERMVPAPLQREDPGDQFVGGRVDHRLSQSKKRLATLLGQWARRSPPLGKPPLREPFEEKLTALHLGHPTILPGNAPATGGNPAGSSAERSCRTS